VLRDLLGYLGANGVRAIVGLDYLGKGWSPEGIDPCRWVTDRRMERAFESYVRGFLERIRAYHDDVSILLFTEPTLLCAHHPADHAAELAADLRPTLGSLPERLPHALRAQFRI